MGALDFAGGTVVHISSGASALVAAIMFGKRIGYGQEAMPPHNLPFSVIGAGFCGSAGLVLMPAARLAADGLATSAFVATHLAAAAAALSWLADGLDARQTDGLGSCQRGCRRVGSDHSGAGFVGPMSAIIIGIGGGVLCSIGLQPETKIRIRRFTRRRRRSWCRRHMGRACDRPVRF